MGSMLMDFVSSIFTAKNDRDSKTKNSWRNLIVDIATSKAKNPDDVLVELERLGRTPEDLKSAIVEYERRVTLAGKYAAVPRIKDEIAIADAEMKDAVAAIEAVKEKFDPIIRTASQRISRLSHELIDGESAKYELINTGSDPLIDDRVAALQARVDQLVATIRDLRRSRDRCRMNIDLAQQSIESTRSRNQRQEFEAELSESKERLERFEGEIATAEAEQRELIAEIERERLAYLDPACVA